MFRRRNGPAPVSPPAEWADLESIVPRVYVSRIERRRDLMLSTAHKYAAALGARCELAFVFGDGRRVIIAEPTGEEPPK